MKFYIFVYFNTYTYGVGWSRNRNSHYCGGLGEHEHSETLLLARYIHTSQKVYTLPLTKVMYISYFCFIPAGIKMFQEVSLSPCTVGHISTLLHLFEPTYIHTYSYVCILELLNSYYFTVSDNL